MEKEPKLLDDIEDLKTNVRETAKSLDRMVSHGTSQVIGPAATKAREVIGRVVKKLWNRDEKP